MPIIRLFSKFANSAQKQKRALYLLALMTLFWAIYEGTISYMTPLIISERGFSVTMMGIIIGTSSIAGAIFDFIACRIFTNIYYKRIFLIMLSLCLIYPFLLSQANTFILFLLTMSIWGVYYDLKNIGNFDFISRQVEKEDNVSSFGLVQIFQSVGLLIAPLITGFLLADGFNYQPLAMAWIFLVIAFSFFLILYFLKDKHAPHPERTYRGRKKTWLGLILIWGDLGKILLPVLILTFMLNFIDAFFWTVGPLFAESLESMKRFAGLFMTAYSLPALLVGWIIGGLAKKHGKKKTAFAALFIGSIFLTGIYFITLPALLIFMVFGASFFISMAWPAIQGAYADYISETPSHEKEIAGLQDFFTNIGYVLGPMSAGFIADNLGGQGAFSFLGVIGMGVAAILFLVTPRKTNVNKELRELKN